MAEERALVAEANAEEYRKRAAAEVEKLDRLKQTVRTQIEEAVASSTATLRRLNSDLQEQLNSANQRVGSHAALIYSLREQIAAEGQAKPRPPSERSPASVNGTARVYPDRGIVSTANVAAVKRAKASGVSAQALIADMGYSAREVRAAGFTVSALRRAGCTVRQLAGLLKVSASELRAAGVSSRQIIDEGGFSHAELAAAGLLPRTALQSADAVARTTMPYDHRSSYDHQRKVADTNRALSSALLYSPSGAGAVARNAAAGFLTAAAAGEQWGELPPHRSLSPQEIAERTSSRSRYSSSAASQSRLPTCLHDHPHLDESLLRAIDGPSPPLGPPNYRMVGANDDATAAEAHVSSCGSLSPEHFASKPSPRQQAIVEAARRGEQQRAHQGIDVLLCSPSPPADMAFLESLQMRPAGPPVGPADNT